MSSAQELDLPRDQETELIKAFLSCHDVREAGKIAGYSDSTINSGYLYQKFQKPDFQEKLKQYAIACDYQDLSFIYGIERNALRYAYEQSLAVPKSALESVSKLRHITTQKKKVTSILRDDTAHEVSQTTININTINAFWAGVLDEPEQITEAEVEDSKGGEG